MDVVRDTFNSLTSKINFLSYLGGICGAFMTGLFSQQSVNPTGGFDGAFYGRPIQLWHQIAGILTAIGNLNKRRSLLIKRGDCFSFCCGMYGWYSLSIGLDYGHPFGERR